VYSTAGPSEMQEGFASQFTSQRLRGSGVNSIRFLFIIA